MTVTDTDAPSSAAEPVAGHGAALAPPRPATGFAALIGTGDHKAIGRLWIATSLLFLLVAGITGGLLGVERIDVSDLGDVLDADVLGQVFGLHAVAGTFLFLIPLLIGLGTYIVPLQVGSPSLAFPRAAAAAYWTYLLSGATVVAAFIADGGTGGTDVDAVGLFLAALIGVLAALCLGAVCVASTGVALRTAGMGLHRAPLFTWSTILAAGLWLLTLPVLAGLLLLTYVDVRYGPTFLGGAEEGSDGIIFRIAWAWSQPSVYVYAIPALGIIGDIVPVAARTRLTLHRVAMGCIGGFAVFSFGAWAMPGFSADGGTPALDYADEIPFLAFSFLILLPLLAFAGLVADTLRKGAPRLVSPLVWSLAALLMLLAGVANGALVSIWGLDLIETTATTSQVHYVLVAVLLAAFGGLAHWSPKLWGRALPETASTGLAVVGLLGTVLLCVPDLVSGLLDQFARFGGVSDDESTVEVLNIASLAGGALLILVALGFIALIVGIAAGRRGDEPEERPWEGNTLEWATAELPPITSEAPVYDARHAAEASS